MSDGDEQSPGLHGGRLVARRLRAQGVDTVFTLSGGHLFSVYDGCRSEGIALVDTRHEATAAFAAEGMAKVTRRPGVAALTAGPGVTNGLSAMGAALQNRSPMVVLGGRAPAWRWGQGSLQEIDHLPFVRPLSRFAATAESPGEIPALVDEALCAALRAPGGPAFVDLPLDHVFSEAPEQGEPAVLPTGRGDGEPDADALARATKLLAEAERPVVMAGTDLWWGHAETALLELAETLRIPVFLNGMARGCVPADHELAFSRVRSAGLKGADVALVVGVPMDFRLGFGGAFGDDTEIVTIDRAEPERAHPRAPAAELHGDLPAILDALRGGIRPDPGTTADWVAHLREQETAARAKEAAERGDDRAPLHPMRLYAELSELLDRDAIVVGDGGDFVSYAGRVIDSHTPGCWLDPGPFGCLGAGPGQALGAALGRPGSQVVLLLGDGAFGFSGMEWDTLVRHRVPVVGIVGNNGIWGLEKHPMEFLYGYSVVADLTPETRYDEVVTALGGHGELVRTPGELRPALERAFAAGGPALVNVLTDPSVAYPRRSNLA